MKKLLSIVLVLVMMASLCACSTPAQQENVGEATVEGAGEEVVASAEYKDTIIFAQNADVTSLDPGVGKEQTAFTVHCNIYDRLIYKDLEGNVYPMLAESWEQVSDSEIKFFLRKGVKFHDGSEMTAEDVKFSFDRAIASSYVGQMVSYLDGVDVVDEYTVIVRAKYPYAPLLGSLSQGTCSIVPKAYVETVGEEEFANKPVGCGPYKFLERVAGESVTLEAFEDYWNGAPKTKYLKMMVVPEAAQRAIMIETGEIDAGYGLLATDILRLNDDPSAQVASAPSSKAIVIYLNMKEGPCADQKVRQAIEYAIDRDSIVDNVLSGMGEATATVISSSLVGYNKDLPKNRYDVEKAKALLAEGGYAEGDINLTMWTNSDQTYVEVATAIQSMLAEVGINMSIETMATGTLLARLKDENSWNMGMHFTNCLTGEGDVTIYNTMSPKASSNYTGYDNPELMAMLDQARGTLELADRQLIYNQMYDIIREDVPNIAVYTEVIAVALGANVEGFELNRTGAHRYENVAVQK
ncbi:MAG: ABC transporter substrate-binding protein [Clostridia bacterium]|nr:ABC transporter substrate-binding protein [Clostridia bacterium]